MKMCGTGRARGSNRGGTGGGYERTDPDYEHNRLRRLRTEYLSLEPKWRATFLRGLSGADERALNALLKESATP